MTVTIHRRAIYSAVAAATVAAITVAAVTLSYRELNRANFRSMLAEDADIRETDDALEIGKKLTNNLYQATSFSPPFPTTNDDALRYRQTMIGEVGNLCSTLSTTLRWALAQFDIPSREVHVASEEFLEGNDVGDTHTFVEISVDGRNIVLDPTFGATYACGGKWT